MKNNFKKIALLALSITLLGIVFSGCEKQSLNFEEETILLIPEKHEIILKSQQKQELDLDFEKKLLSIIVAKSLLNIEFRNLLKEEAMKQFDGDYDILYQNVKNVNFTKGKTIEDFLFENYLTEKGKTSDATKENFNRIISLIPDFQISIPVNCDKWNSNTEIPLVTYIPYDFDEQTTQFVKAFDFKGNVYILPVGQTPNVPVIVIGSNERINIQPTNDEPTITQTSKLTRADGMKEILKELKFTNLSYYESWLQGKPEIELSIFASDKTKIKTWTVVPKREDVDNVYKEYNSYLIRWYFGSYGDFLIYCWVELDGGGTTTTTYTYKDPNTGLTTTITTTGSERDDKIGCSPVHKNDPNNEEYDLGMFRWIETFEN